MIVNYGVCREEIRVSEGTSFRVGAVEGLPGWLRPPGGPEGS